METDPSNIGEANNSILYNSVKHLAANMKATLLIIFLSIIACSLKPLALSIPVDPFILKSLAMPFATHATMDDYFHLPRSHYSVRAALALTILHLVFFLLIVTTIHYVFLRCSKEQATTAKELALAIIGSSAATFFTRLCLILLDLVSKFPLLAAAKIADLPILLDFPLIFLVGLVLGIATILLIYLRSVWLLTLAASAVENKWGVSAVRRAFELVHGKQRQVIAFACTSFLLVESFVGFLVAVGRIALGKIAIEFVTAVGMAVLGVVLLASHVLLYYELSKRCGDDQAASAKKYSVLTADDPSACLTIHEP